MIVITVSPLRLSTAIPGLDEILYGGLIPGRAYLVRGGPGTGKTTLGLHFLTAGAAAGGPMAGLKTILGGLPVWIEETRKEG